MSMDLISVAATANGGAEIRVRGHHLTVDIEVPADLPPEKKKAVRRIAEKCPIHATLSSQPRIDIDVL